MHINMKEKKLDRFYISSKRPLRPITYDTNKRHQYSFEINGHSIVNLVAPANYAESC